MSNEVAGLTLAIDATQVDKGAASLDKLTAAGARAESKAKDVNASFAITAGIKSATEQMTFHSQQVQKVLDRYDPLGTKLRSLQSDFAMLRNEMGNDTTTAAAKAFQGLEDEIVKTKTLMQTAGVEGFEAIKNGAEKSAFATAGARRELIVLGHEAISGNFSRIPGSLMVLAERTGASAAGFGMMAAAALGAVGALGAVIFASAKAEEAARSLAVLERQFTASGMSALVMSGQVRGMVDEVSRMPGVTQVAADKIVGSFAHVQSVSGSMMEQLLRMTPDVAAALGVDMPKAASVLAEAFAKPGEGAKKLDAELNFLTADQMLLIESFVKTGDTLSAQKELYRDLQTRVVGLHEQGITPMQFAVEELSKSWSTMMGNVSKSQGWETTRTLMGFVVDRMAWMIDHAADVAMAVASVLPGGQAASLIPGVSPYSQSQSGKIRSGTSTGSSQALDEVGLKSAVMSAQATHGMESETAKLQAQAEDYRNWMGKLVAANRDGEESYQVLQKALEDTDKKIAKLAATKAPKFTASDFRLDDMQLAEKQLVAEDKLLETAQKKIDKQNEAVDALSREAAGWKTLTEVQRVSWDIQSGKYADFDTQSQNELLRIAQIIDLNKQATEIEKEDAALMKKVNADQIADTDATIAHWKKLSEMDSFAKNMAKSIQRSFADFLFDPFKNGTKGMLQGFVDVVRRMVAEALSAKISRALFGDMISGGQGSGLLGGAFDGLFGNSSAADNTSFSGGINLSALDIKPFANGGDPPVGKVSLVGEKGPELFVPKSAGTVIPNKSIGGGGMQVTYAPVITVDSRTDRADIISTIDRMVRNGNAQLVDQLKRQRKIT